MSIREGSQRRNLRLAGWDYRSPGPYGITIVTRNRAWLFGNVVDGHMVLSEPGTMVDAVWREMATEFLRVTLDAYVVMPNHMHAILHLSHRDQERNPTIGEVIQRFKSITTARYSASVHSAGWEPYDRRLWQQEYYDHIIRDETDLDRCRRYILANPANWDIDRDRDPVNPSTEHFGV